MQVQQKLISAQNFFNEQFVRWCKIDMTFASANAVLPIFTSETPFSISQIRACLLQANLDPSLAFPDSAHTMSEFFSRVLFTLGKQLYDRQEQLYLSGLPKPAHTLEHTLTKASTLYMTGVFHGKVKSDQDLSSLKQYGEGIEALAKSGMMICVEPGFKTVFSLPNHWLEASFSWTQDVMEACHLNESIQEVSFKVPSGKRSYAKKEDVIKNVMEAATDAHPLIHCIGLAQEHPRGLSVDYIKTVLGSAEMATEIIRLNQKHSKASIQWIGGLHHQYQMLFFIKNPDQIKPILENILCQFSSIDIVQKWIRKL